MYGNRIKELRAALKITQDVFAEKVTISRNYLSLLESDKREPSDIVLKSICREFSVSEQWLRSGEGEMFVQKTGLVADLVKKYSFPDIVEKMLESYSRLDEDQQQAVLTYVQDFIASIIEDGTGSVEESIEESIEEKVESYRQELEAEKMDVSVSRIGKESAG